MLLLVDEGRAGQHGLATAEDVAVLLVEVELGDGHVALQVGLLVDGELDLAVLHGLRRVRVGVEGADLRLAARSPRMALSASRACGAPRVMIQLIDLSWVSLAWIAEVTAESSAPLTCMFSVFGKLSFTPAQRSSRATEPACWMVQRILVAPAACDPLARLLTGEVLVGGEVRERAGLLEVVDAGVEAVDRDPGSDGLLDRGDEGVRGDQGGGDAVDLGVDRVLDEDGLLGGVGVGRVLQCRASVLGGLLGAGLDPVPERVAGRLVGDHGEGVAGVAAATAAPAGFRLGLGAAAATGGQRECCGRCEGGQGQALSRSARAPSPLRIESSVIPFVVFRARPGLRGCVSGAHELERKQRGRFAASRRGEIVADT